MLGDEHSVRTGRVKAGPARHDLVKKLKKKNCLCLEKLLQECEK